MLCATKYHCDNKNTFSLNIFIYLHVKETNRYIVFPVGWLGETELRYIKDGIIRLNKCIPSDVMNVTVGHINVVYSCYFITVYISVQT